MDYPAPLRHKLMLTVLLGIACFLIGFAVFLNLLTKHFYKQF
jgi:hypothetical protein